MHQHLNSCFVGWSWWKRQRINLAAPLPYLSRRPSYLLLLSRYHLLDLPLARSRWKSSQCRLAARMRGASPLLGPHIMHNPHENTLAITAEVANSLVHRFLVDSGSTVNILYWDAYQKTGLKWVDLTPMTSPLYGFTGDSVIPEGSIKLAVTLGEPPRAATVVIDFFAMKCPQPSTKYWADCY